MPTEFGFPIVTKRAWLAIVLQRLGSAHQRVRLPSRLPPSLIPDDSHRLLVLSKGFLRLTKEQPVHAKVMAGILSELLQLTMQRMVSSVPLTDLVRKVTADHSGSRLGELREMVESLLGTYGIELQVFESAITIFHQDVHTMRREHRSLRIEGHPVQSVITVPLKACEGGPSSLLDVAQSGTVASDRKDVTLCAGANGNAALVDVNGVSQYRTSNNGLAASLSTLRSRRRAGSISTGVMSRGNGSAPTMMTMNERLFHAGEIEPVLYGPRPVGALGTAEHRGRLMTFQ